METQLGKELQDILEIAKIAGLSQEELNAALLGRIGVNLSCWKEVARARVLTGGAIPPDPTVRM